MQLILSGKQNKYITGNPQTTHFKSVYFRHTNFAMESIPCTFNNTISSNKETDVVSIVQRSGDLVSGAHIEFVLKRTQPGTLPTDGSYINWTNSTGHALIKEISFEINSQVIDKHYSEWFDIWNELTDVNYKEHAIVNKHLAKKVYLKSNDLRTNYVKCYVPLNFWFCRNPGLAYPLIALQNTKSYIKVKFRNPYTLINTDCTTNSIGTISYDKHPELYLDYIYLDTKERRSFVQKDHQYLIDTLQFNGEKNFSENHDLNFENPIKELIWVIRNKNVKTEYDLSTISNKADANSNTILSLTKNNDYFNYTSESGSSQTEHIYTNTAYEPFNEAELILNGNSRFNKRNATYFRTVQPYTYHSRIPSKHIYVYSFALKPEEHQPSGVCNFSKLKSAQLKFTNPNKTNTEILIYAFSYNLLRIKNGQAGLAYAQ